MLPRPPSPNDKYVVLTDIGNLKNGEQVEYIGFSDIDNHVAIHVFVETKGAVLEVSGDFSGRSSTQELIGALKRI